ncbi:hypothetical protein Hdeb2414_s0839g00952711 [Helianthus debilis subsp. tardiflorus]
MKYSYTLLVSSKVRKDVISQEFLIVFALEVVSGITVQIERSLLTTSNGCLHMHDLIQEMGWCIVRECYPNKMVWCSKEIKEVMTITARLETVEAIAETQDNYDLCCSEDIFKSMKKLKLLQVRGRFISGVPTYFPEQLKWLRWFFYPFPYLIITRDASKLVGLEMTFGWMYRLHIKNGVQFVNLKVVLCTSLTLPLLKQTSSISRRSSLPTSSSWIYVTHSFLKSFQISQGSQILSVIL